MSVALVGAVAIRAAARHGNHDALQRGIFAWPCALAFAVGYWGLGHWRLGGLDLADANWQTWIPTRHWQWLPFVTLASGLLASVGASPGLAKWERAILPGLLILVGSILLTPSWASLEPPRVVYVAGLFIALTTTAWATRVMQRHISASMLLFAYLIVGLTVSLSVLVNASIRLGQLAAISTAAVAGIWLASCWMQSRRLGGDAKESTLPTSSAEFAGVAVAHVLVWFSAFVGHVEPNPPMYAVLLMPLIPLLLWPTLIPAILLQNATRLAVFRVAIVVTTAASLGVWLSYQMSLP